MLTKLVWQLKLKNIVLNLMRNHFKIRCVLIERPLLLNKTWRLCKYKRNNLMTDPDYL